MKKLISFILVLAMAASLAACGCDHSWEEATCTASKTCAKCGKTEGDPLDHTPGELAVSAVDTGALTMTYDLPCQVCGEVIETKNSATGVAPVGSVIAVSPEEWYQCLLTNVANYGLGQSLYSYPVESEDGALLHSVISMSMMSTVFSYQDTEGNVITTDKADVRGSVHNIRMDAQFDNSTAQQFFMTLMLIILNNNSALETEAANTLATQIMSGETVSDNGFTYAMEVVSVEDHRVCVSITAE